MDKVIMKTGHTLEVTSWENDGDNYRTLSLHCKSIDEVYALEHMFKTIFISSNNGDDGIGNMMDDCGDEAKYVILHYLVEHPALLEINNLIEPKYLQDKVIAFYGDEDNFKNDEWADWLVDFIGESEDSKFVDWVDMAMDYNYGLMGGSEYYYSRIYESSVIYYTKEDLKCEVVKSKSVRIAF